MRERRTALVVLATASLAVGIWALFAPHSFYASFPFGRGWVALDGPYNEHLIRDFGAMNLALATVTSIAAWRLRADVIRIAAAATLVFALPHLAFHGAHLEHYQTADALANLAALSGQVILPLWLVLFPGTGRDRPTVALTSADTRA